MSNVEPLIRSNSILEYNAPLILRYSYAKLWFLLIKNRKCFIEINSLQESATDEQEEEDEDDMPLDFVCSKGFFK